VPSSHADKHGLTPTI